MSTTTHYHTLNLPRTATQDQIRRAYRTLAKALHPDVNPSKDAAKKFAKLAAAYETLSNVQSRRTYDRSLAATEESAPAPGRAHYAWENVASPRDRNGKPADISEIDDLYDTFFSRRSTKSSKPAPTPQSRAAPKSRRSRAT